MNLYAIILVALIIGGTIYSAYEKGYENATNAANLAQLEANAEHQARLDELKEELLDVEKAWLNEEAEIEIVVQEKVRTVTNVVEKIIVDNNLAHCRVGDVGLQAINKALSETKFSKGK